MLIQINASIATAAYSRSKFSFTNGNMGKNAIIFGADMSSTVHIDNKNKNMITGKK